MAYKPATRIFRVNEFIKDNKQITISFNSYKDGSMEIDIAEGEYLSKHEIANDNIEEVYIIINKVLDFLLKSIAVHKINVNKYNPDIFRAYKFAKNMKGEMTSDYKKMDCHSKVVIAYYSTKDKNVKEWLTEN